LLAHVNEVSAYLREKFQEIGKNHHNMIGPVHTLGGVQSVSVFDLEIARKIYSNLFKHGVLCHSVCEVGVPTIKFLPPIVLTKSEADEIVEAFRASIADL